MSEYFIIVNESKKEFVDAVRFGENPKRGAIFTGLHGHAIGLLLTDSAFDPEGLIGSWCGDRIVVAGEMAPTEGDTESLYFRAKHEGYMDVSLVALSIVAKDPQQAKQLVVMAKSDAKLLADLQKIAMLHKRTNLKYYFEREFGGAGNA